MSLTFLPDSPVKQAAFTDPEDQSVQSVWAAITSQIVHGQQKPTDQNLLR